MFSENGMMLALQATNVAEHQCRKAVDSEYIESLESFESFPTSACLRVWRVERCLLC